MDTSFFILTILVGVGVISGVALFLAIEDLTLRSSFERVLKERERLQAALQGETKKHYHARQALIKAQAQSARLNDSLAYSEQLIHSHQNDNKTLQQRLADTQTQVEVLQGNLKRVTDHAELLQSDLEERSEQIETAVAENESLGEQLAKAQREIETLHSENQTAYHEIAASEGRLEMLHAQVVQFQQQAERTIALEAQTEALQAEVDRAQQRVTDLKTVMTRLMEKLELAGAAQQQVLSYQEKLSEADLRIEQLQARLAQLSTQLEYSGKNELQIIRGIGPTYAKRLNEAGVHSLADLAQQDPGHVAAVVKLKPWQNHEPSEWIAEAGRLSNGVQFDEEE